MLVNLNGKIDMKKLISLYIAFILYLPLVNGQTDSTLFNAEQFFNLFITGKPEAYNYFANEFKEKVTSSQINTIHEQFLVKYGKFNKIEKSSKITQQGVDYILLNTSFGNASPLFTLPLAKNGKFIGFLLSKENIKVTYKDPEYANKDLYEEKEITLQVGEFKMPGIVTIPKHKKNFPILVLIHGSGNGDKDQTVFALKPFRDLALGLAAQGIATLRYDKRTSIYSNPVSKGEDFTVKQETEDDALAAIALAKNFAGVDKKQIYCLGLSLGGMLMPRIAAKTTDLAGIVIAAGPARPFQDISIEQNTLSFTQKLINQKTLDSAIVLLNETRFKTLGNRKPNSTTLYGPASYILDLNNYNQTETIKKFKGKILIIQGEKDFQVSITDFNLWKKAVKGNRKATAVSFSTLGHPFVLAGKTNTIADYNFPQNIPIEVINTLSNWILTQ